MNKFDYIQAKSIEDAVKKGFLKARIRILWQGEQALSIYINTTFPIWNCWWF